MIRNRMKSILGAFFLCGLAFAQAAETERTIPDFIRLGDAESERAHQFSGKESAIVKNSIGVAGRKILKPEKEVSVC